MRCQQFHMTSNMYVSAGASRAVETKNRAVSMAQTPQGVIVVVGGAQLD